MYTKNKIKVFLISHKSPYQNLKSKNGLWNKMLTAANFK